MVRGFVVAGARAGRVCDGCGRPLSRYNPGLYCQGCSRADGVAGQSAYIVPQWAGNADLGVRLHALRKRRRMTLTVLSDFSGLSISFLSMIERGQRTLNRYSDVIALAAALRVPPAELAPGMPGDIIKIKHGRPERREAGGMQPLSGSRQEEGPMSAEPFKLDTEFAGKLRRLMAERGVGVRELARRAHFNPGHISKLASGKNHPSSRAAELLDIALGGEGRLAALVPVVPAQQAGGQFVPRDVFPVLPDPSLAPDPDMYQRITRAIENGEHVDSEIIAWLERCLVEHRRIEDTVGARPLVDVVRVQISTVTRLARQARTPVTDRLVDLAAQYAQFMAWLCNDSGNKAAALAWYDRAHDWAIEAGDTSMAATTLSMKAHLAWSVGDAIRCVRFGESARWHDSRASLGIQGMAAQMTARGHALCGDADSAHRELDDAEGLIAAAASRPEDEPPWMYFYGDTWFTAQRGMVETELAERHKGGTRTAVPLLEKALNSLPDSYRRDRIWYGTVLARAHATAGDCDAAAGTALKFAADAMAVNRYAADELKGLAVTLAQRGVREADDLSEALTVAAPR
jgi:transcriptional regulator with XRE-family HTH domain